MKGAVQVEVTPLPPTETPANHVIENYSDVSETEASLEPMHDEHPEAFLKRQREMQKTHREIKKARRRDLDTIPSDDEIEKAKLITEEEVVAFGLQAIDDYLDALDKIKLVFLSHKVVKAKMNEKKLANSKEKDSDLTNSAEISSKQKKTKSIIKFRKPNHKRHGADRIGSDPTKLLKTRSISIPKKFLIKADSSELASPRPKRFRRISISEQSTADSTELTSPRPQRFRRVSISESSTAESATSPRPDEIPPVRKPPTRSKAFYNSDDTDTSGNRSRSHSLSQPEALTEAPESDDSKVERAYSCPDRLNCDSKKADVVIIPFNEISGIKYSTKELTLELTKLDKDGGIMRTSEQKIIFVPDPKNTKVLFDRDPKNSKALVKNSIMLYTYHLHFSLRSYLIFIKNLLAENGGTLRNVLFTLPTELQSKLFSLNKFAVLCEIINDEKLFTKWMKTIPAKHMNILDVDMARYHSSGGLAVHGIGEVLIQMLSGKKPDDPDPYKDIILFNDHLVVLKEAYDVIEGLDETISIDLNTLFK
jgi:hypothetical protein